MGKFMKGIFVGGLVGATVVSNWNMLSRNCPALKEMADSFFGTDTYGRHVRREAHSADYSRTRLMARKFRKPKI